MNYAEVRFEKEILKGSIIDIDTQVWLDQCTDFSEAINRAHGAEKELFFSLLNKDFIEALNPVYPEG